jgi:hypothetical protein
MNFTSNAAAINRFSWSAGFHNYKNVVYADDVNLLGDNIHAIKKNMETLIDASKEVCPPQIPHD